MGWLTLFTTSMLLGPPHSEQCSYDLLLSVCKTRFSHCGSQAGGPCNHNLISWNLNQRSTRGAEAPSRKAFPSEVLDLVVAAKEELPQAGAALTDCAATACLQSGALWVLFPEAHDRFVSSAKGVASLGSAEPALSFRFTVVGCIFGRLERSVTFRWHGSHTISVYCNVGCLRALGLWGVYRSWSLVPVSVVTSLGQGSHHSKGAPSNVLLHAPNGENGAVYATMQQLWLY